jgi:hypothetical protein
MKNLFSKASETYTTNVRNSTILESYKANMIRYIKKTNSNLDTTIIEDFIDEVVKDNFKDREAHLLFQTSLGNFDFLKKGLLAISNKLTGCTISPYGSVFKPKHEVESMFSNYVKKRQLERKEIKKKEIIAQAKRNKHEEQALHVEQLNIKIDINALTGIMLSNTFFYSPISYNSITSAARFNIMLAYSYTELFLAGNLHFINEQKAINWVINLLRVYPGNSIIRESVSMYDLYIPTIEDVYSFLIGNLNIYAKFGRKKTIKNLITRLDESERIFVFYASNLFNIFRFNPQFKKYLKDIFNYKSRLDMYDSAMTSIYDVPDEQLMNLVSVIMAEEIGNIAISDIDSKAPALAKGMLSYYSFLTDRLSKLDKLFESFVFLDNVPNEIMKHKSMIRNVTIVSDTDSIIFTTVEWAKWFTGGIELTNDSFAMNAFITYMVGKALEHVFSYTSACMGIAEDDIKGISIKNEYTFTVFIRTTMSKHYTGLMRYREGARLSPQKFELKGKNFIGSDICKQSSDNVDDFIKWVLNTIITKYVLKSEELLAKVILIEQSIIRSIKNGERIYFNQKPINNKNEYDKPESKSYFYFMIWEEVLTDKRGEVYLPQKFQVVPIHPITLRNHKSLEPLKATNKPMYDKFVKFLEKFPKRTIKTLFIPTGYQIPVDIMYMINYTQIVYDNCVPIYLFLKSLNIVNSSTKKRKELFSDTYPRIRDEIIDILNEAENITIFNKEQKYE